MELNLLNSLSKSVNLLNSFNKINKMVTTVRVFTIVVAVSALLFNTYGFLKNN